MKTVIFLNGSSGVGKSSICEALRSKYPFRVVQLSARTPRGMLNNPNFSEIEGLATLGMKHQEFVFAYFKRSIRNKLEYISNSIHSDNYIFERGLLDVVGYSYAFSQMWKWHDYTAWVDYQLCSARMFEAEIKLDFPDLNIKSVYVPINKDIPYEAIEARPNENIRNLCNQCLVESMVSDYGLEVGDIESYAESVYRISNI